MTKTVDEVKERIRDYVQDAVNIPDLEDDENLFETGIVNSLFAVQLIAFLEKSFAITVESDDLDIVNFQSIEATATFVMEKL